MMSEFEADSTPFADRLVSRCRELGHPLCVGLDPHLDRLPPLFQRGSMDPTDPETADAVDDFLTAVLDRLEGRVAVVKPQIAFFEALGWAGLRMLEGIIHHAQDLGLLVLLDAKRGDIGSTAAAYARAHLGEDAPFPAQALTVSPYLGLDTLEPFIDRAATTGSGLFVLVKTSNPGAGDLQDRRIASTEEGIEEGTEGEGAELYLHLATELNRRAERLAGPATGWSGLGAVVGATGPEQAEAVRERLPKSLFLVPGYGAQGGQATDAVRGFVPGPNGLEGGIVSSSRGILFPEGSDTDDDEVWEQAIDGALDRAIDELGAAVGG